MTADRPPSAREFAKARVLALSEIAAVLLAICTIATLGASVSAFLDVLTSFRHLYAIGAVGCATALAVGRRHVFAGVALAVLATNLAFVARALPTGSGCEPSVVVVTLNALGPDNDVNSTLAFLAAEDADIVVVTELGTALDAALQGPYPHHHSVPRNDTAGMGIFSRFALSNTHTTSGEWFPQLSANVDVRGTAIALLAVHPPPPMIGDSAARRNREIRDIAGQVSSLPHPLVLAGDLNLTRQSPHFSPLVQAGLIDSRVGNGIAGTWPARLPFRVGIDHILHTSEITTCDLRVGPSNGSDHLPLVARLQM